MKLGQVHGYYASMLFLTKYESNLIGHGSCSPSHYNEDTIYLFVVNLKICHNFVVTKFFLIFDRIL